LKSVGRERAIDIVHSHDYKTNLLAWLLSRRTDIIPLATSHGWSGFSAKERYVYYPVEKRLLARFPRVIAVSNRIKAELVGRGADPNRVTVLLNGIDPDAFRRRPETVAGIRAANGFDSGDIVLGAVGRLEREKRYDLLIDAFARLAAAHPRLRLAFVGDGTLAGALKEQAQRLGVGDAVRFLGHRLDVASLYHAFDLFVQSSETEGTPNAVLEAMAMETPIVATDVGGTREIAFPGEHAIIVAPLDVEALSAGIERALADPAGTAARAAAARRRIETDLSFDARTRRLEAIYEELMAGVVHA
jgi:glycosyltransferase involved in cell wall biosynthesis